MIEAWFDGSCGPINPGGNGFIGVFIKLNGLPIYKLSKYVGCGPGMTSNVAEYQALIHALQYILNNGGKDEEIRVYGDSSVVIGRMKKKGQISNGLCRIDSIQCRKLVDQFTNLTLQWIPREINTVADQLSKEHDGYVTDHLQDDMGREYLRVVA